MSLDIALRNDHHVYILGAGYSVARGMPLISGFLNRMRDAAIWFETQGRSEEKEAIHDVLKFRLSAAASAYRVPIDLENVEELFSLASASDQCVTESAKLAIAATLAYCAEQVVDPYLYLGEADASKMGVSGISKPFNSSDKSILRASLYDALALKLLIADQPGRSSVITFNYDDIVERSVASIGQSFHYGFSKRPNVEAGVSYDESGLAILKLHGSVNWSNDSNNFQVFKSYESLRKSNLVPKIVPPTWNKTIGDRLAEVWSSAISKLSTATKIFVVGFSMPKTDQHFKYLLAAGMKDNFSLREIVFVDPSEDLIRVRASDLIASREIDNKRVRFVSSRVEDVIGTRVQEVAGRYIRAKASLLDITLNGLLPD